MNTTLENLKRVRASIEALEKIATECDPASGVSFAVRRGVSWDNEDNPGDKMRRPWTTVEVSDTAGKQAIGSLISGLRASEQFWIRTLSEETEEATKFLRSIAQNGGEK